MKQKLVFILAVFILASCGNEAEKQIPSDTATGKVNSIPDSAMLNFTDAAGLRQGHWIITGSMKHDPQYAPDAKVEEGMYRDGKKEGLWKTYDANGNLKSEDQFVNDRRSDQ